METAIEQMSTYILSVLHSSETKKWTALVLSESSAITTERRKNGPMPLLGAYDPKLMPP